MADLILLQFFFFNDTATTEIYTLSLHDALPICTDRLCPRNPDIVAQLHLAVQDEMAVSLQDVLLRRTGIGTRSEEHTSELQSQSNLVCRLLLEKKNTTCTSLRASRMSSSTCMLS